MPLNTWACAPNFEGEAFITDFKKDASIEDNGEDAEDMEVSSDDESDEDGNCQTNFDIRMQPRHKGKSFSSKTVVLVQA